MGLPPQGIKKEGPTMETIIEYYNPDLIPVPQTVTGASPIVLAAWEITNSGDSDITDIVVARAFCSVNLKCDTASVDLLDVYMGYQQTNPATNPEDATVYDDVFYGGNTWAHTFAIENTFTPNQDITTTHKYFVLGYFFNTGNLTDGDIKNINMFASIYHNPTITIKRVI